jgi:hypothetical protein
MNEPNIHEIVKRCHEAYAKEMNRPGSQLSSYLRDIIHQGACMNGVKGALFYVNQLAEQVTIAKKELEAMRQEGVD